MAGENKQLETRIRMTSDQEAEVLTSAFKGKDDLLKATRLLLFGLPISEESKNLIKATFADQTLKKAFRRKMYPVFEEDMTEVPLTSLIDFWYGTEQNIIGQSRDTIHQTVSSKQKVQYMFVDAMKLLDNPDEVGVNLVYNPSDSVDELGINLLARNLFIRSINEGINLIKMIADKETETPEQIKARQEKNSSK